MLKSSPEAETMIPFSFSKSKQYYVRDQKGGMSGPFSLEVLESKLKGGELKGSEALALDREGEWREISNIPYFCSLLIDLLALEALPSRQREITKVLGESALVRKAMPLEGIPQKEGSEFTEQLLEKRVQEKVKTVIVRSQKEGGGERAKIVILPRKKEERGGSWLREPFFSRWGAVLAAIAIVGGSIWFFGRPTRKLLLTYEEPIRIVIPSPLRAAPDPAKFETHFHEAEVVFAQDTLGGYKFAVTELIEAIKADPNQLGAWALLADTYARLWPLSAQDNDYAEGIHHLVRRVKKGDPQSGPAERALAQLAFERGEWELADRHVSKALELSPHDGRAKTLAAWIAYRKREGEKAKELATEALEIDTTLLRAYQLLGTLFIAEGKEEEGLNFWKQGLASHPEHPGISLAWGEYALEKLKDPSVAEGYLKRVIETPKLVFPRDLGKAHSLLGMIYQSRGKKEEAIEQFQMAHLNDPSQPSYLESLRRMGGSPLAAREKDSLVPRESAQYFVHLAEEHLREGRVDDAIAQFRTALDLRPGDPLLHAKLGEAYEKANRLDRAMAAYESSIQAKGDYWEGHLKLASLYIRLQRLAEAKALLNKIEANQPHLAGYYLVLGKFYSQQGLYKQAAQIQVKAAEQDPNDDAAWVDLGNSYLSLGRAAEAREIFQKMNKKRPEWTFVYSKIAEAVFREGFKNEALKYMKQVVEKDPGEADHLIGLAHLYALAGETKLAIEPLERAIEIDSANEVTWKMLAENYVKIGEYDQALKIYSKLEKLAPYDADPRFQKGAIYLQMGEKGRALTELNAVIRLNERYPGVYVHRGNLLIQLGYEDAAISAFLKEEHYYPNDADPYEILARIYTRRGQYNDAVLQYTKLIELQPERAESYVGLGKVYRNLGRTTHAIEMFKAALERDPDFAEAYFHLGELYSTLDRRDAAIEAYRHYLRRSPAAENVRDVEKKIKELELQ
ncbi:MAG: tetratricopeptide repeat protein [Deltaproteobacteria bacterium]|nr:tetratricopeptide repeat protein [Deltaproteobacteria bacterium]